jgi:hypothetical protein
MNLEEVHWYYIDDANNDAQIGPFVIKDFREKFLSGGLTPESYCWHEEIDDWEKLKNISFRGKPALHYFNENIFSQKSEVPKSLKNNTNEVKTSEIEEEIRERLRRKFGK